MKKITASILTTLLMLSMVFSSSVFAANEETSAWDSFLGLFSAKASADDVGVEYRGHIQNVGDYPTDGSWIQGPERLGTVGKSLRLEAFWIKLTDAPEGLHIKYEVHVQNIGWMDPVEDGALAGTQGDSLRIEAIKISLVDDEGNVSGDYTVTYKGHIQNVGDTAWIKSGQQLGTTGSGLRLEALEVKIEKIAPDLTDYEAALAAVTEANYTKASWAAYQDVVEDNVMTEDNVQSEVDAATAIILDAQADLVTKAVVTSAAATTQNTITLQGAALNKLTAADITVKNITVSSVVANADGTSATVALASDLIADTDTPVAIKSDGDTSNFTVKYTIAAQTLAVTGSLFDLTLNGQKLGLTLNGAAVTADYLAANGYTVEFRAWNAANAAVCNTLFGTATATTPSATGAIAVPQVTAAYTVNATVKKGSTILTSEKVSIQLLDLVNSGSSILSYKKVQTTPATNAVMNSTTMLVGEATTIQNVVVQYSPTNTVDLGTTGYVLETSNKNVISVAGNIITAVAPGTATITIRVGTVTTTIPYTVAQGTRTPVSVTPSTSQVNGIISGGAITTSNTVKVVDQYGDPVVGMTAAPSKFVTIDPATFAQVKVASTGNVGGFTLAAVDLVGVSANDIALGTYNVPFTAGGATLESGQIQTVVFTNVNGTNVGSFTVKTTGDNGPVTTKAEYKAGSLNQTNSLNANVNGMTEIDLVINQYNSSGVKLGPATPLTNYVVVFDPAKIIVTDNLNTPAVGGTFTCVAGTTEIVIKPVAGKQGTTPIQIFTSVAQTTMIDSRSITVSASTPKITAIGLKTATPVIGTIDYTSVLNYSSRAGLDPIVDNVTLSEASAYDVCLDLTTKTIIYLDTNRNGAYNAGVDTAIGSLAFTGSGTNITPGPLGANVAITAGADGTFTYTIWDTTPLPTSPQVVVTSNTVVVKLV